jgi:signal transduction histidine kinase
MASFGTLAYGISAGTTAAIALIFILLAVQSRRVDRLFVPFGIFGLVATSTTVMTLALHSATSVEAYADLFKLFGLGNLLGVIAVVVLVDAWTGGVRRRERQIFLLSTGIIAVLQVVLPSGLLVGEIVALRDVSMLGETFVVHEGTQSAWRPAVDIYLIGVAALIVTALVRRFREGYRDDLIAILLALCVLLGANTVDSLVDVGIVDSPYVLPFGQMIVVVWAAFYLAYRVADTEERLASQASVLEQKVTERTAALLRSRDTLKRQLARQQSTARQLLVLADDFELIGTKMINTDTGEVTEAVRSVLGSIAELVDADSVSLDLTTETDARSVLPTTVRWSARNRDHAAAPDPLITHARLQVAGRSLGELQVRTWFGPLDAEQRGYLELAAEHLAGVIHRFELLLTIADAAVSAERERLARDLHDSVTQRLYSVSFLAEATPRQIADEPDRATRTVHQLQGLVRSSLAELRLLLYELNPSSVEHSPLGPLLNQLAEMIDSTSPVSVEARLDAAPELPSDVKLCFYRIAQEALSNAVRHSGSDEVTLTLESDRNEVTLEVADDGCGFVAIDPPPGYGLINMVERAEEVGARTEIDSGHEQGTTVRVKWGELVS